MAVNTDFLPANYAGKWNWAIVINGYEAARFMTGDRPKASFEIMEVNPGGTHRPVKQPGRLSFDDLTFEAGEISGDEAGDFVEWMEDCLSFADGDGQSVAEDAFRQVEIYEYDNGGNVLNQWKLYGAFISNYDGNDLDGSSSDVLTESITITYQYFTRSHRA